MAERRYDPYAAARLWKRMYDHQGDYSARVVDHPIYSERYKKAEELARAFSQYYTPGKVNSDHQAILRNNGVFGPGPENPSALQPGQGAGFLALLETVADGMTKHYAAKAEEARQESRVINVNLVNSLMDYTNVRITDSHTMRWTVKYNGISVLNNLTFEGVLGNERVTQKLDTPVQSGDVFDLVFTFETDIKQAMDQDTQFYLGVTHVDL